MWTGFTAKSESSMVYCNIGPGSNPAGVSFLKLFSFPPHFRLIHVCVLDCNL